MRLDKAEMTLKKSGFENVDYFDRRGDRSVIVKSNWTVIDQAPPPGEVDPKGRQVKLGILKTEEVDQSSRPTSTLHRDSTTTASTTTANGAWTKAWDKTTCHEWRSKVSAGQQLIGADSMLRAFRQVDHLSPKPELAINMAAAITNVCSVIPDNDTSFSVGNLAIKIYVTDKDENHPQGFQSP